MVLPGYLGRTAVIESIWLQSANLARALGARLGRADILTPAGLLSPEEVEARAILPESEGSSARAVATRLPTQLALLAAEARSWLRAQAFRRAALRLTAGRRYSLVVQVHRRHHTAGEAIAHRDGVPYVRRVEALEVREEAAWGVRRPFWGGLVEHVAEVAPIKRADAVAVISRALDDQLEQAGVSGNRRWILPSGVDTNRFSPGVADRELLRRNGMEGRFVVGWIGGFRPFHGLELIPRIASRIRDENLDAVLCLVGTGPSYDDVARSVQYLEDRVVLVGPAPHADVPRWVRSFDACLLLASSAEFHYSPLKLYEYMACGRPVIAASAGEIVDLIEDEVNGLLVPPGDADAVVVALEKLISDPVLLAELGRRARETVEASGSWEARASDVLAVLARRGLLSVGE